MSGAMVIGEPPLVSTLRVYVPQNSSREARRILPLILVGLGDLADCSPMADSCLASVTLSVVTVSVGATGVAVLAIVVDSTVSFTSMVVADLSIVAVTAVSVVTTALSLFSAKSSASASGNLNRLV